MSFFRRQKTGATAPDSARLIGAGLWQQLAGRWEVVRVRHDEETDLFYFETSKHTYGANVGGYGRNELATLYLTGKLTLSPERLAGVAPGRKAAVILNAHGEAVLAHPNPEDGLDPLITDPAFHAPTDA